MKIILTLSALTVMVILTGCTSLHAQSKGLKTITEKELKYHLDFLGAREFRGRETPSPELEITSLYLGNWAKYSDLKPLLKDGTFYQSVPVAVTSVFQPDTRMRISKRNGEQIYYFGKSFSGNFTVSGNYRGNVVFTGLGIHDPENGWDDLKGLDLKGKIVVILDAQKPGFKYVLGSTFASRLTSRISVIRDRGATAVLSVVSPDRDKRRVAGINIFDYVPTGRMGLLFDSQKTNFLPPSGQNVVNEGLRPVLPFEKAEISHDLAAEILGVPFSEIGEYFRTIEEGRQVPSKEIPGIMARLDVEVETYQSNSRNVIAVVEGSDPILKNEYVLVCGHHDARGIDDGDIIAGADDNGTATVALMEIAQALLAERPRRSVILAWFAGEEQGMNGSHYFVNNSPVPLEKISACLNVDMIGRNDPDSLFLVGSDLLSTELDGAIKKVNKKWGLNFGFDYRYSNLTHPQRVYFRSDHYPFIRFGIPSVWIFSGFTPDYHTVRDVPENVNYLKFYRTTKLIYLASFVIANRKDLLKLDVNQSVTSRGEHNLKESSLFR